MALVLDGNGTIAGLSAGGLPSGSVDATSLASTLDLSSKTMTFGNVSASGITFPASVSASSNPNTLDDYEEGTWTPTVGGSGGDPTGVTYATQKGTYTKIGRVVTVAFNVTFTTYSGGSGYIRINNLPFTTMSGYEFKGSLLTENVTFSSSRTYIITYINGNENFARAAVSGSGNTYNWVYWTDVSSGASGKYFEGQVTYFV